MALYIPNCTDVPLAHSPQEDLVIKVKIMIARVNSSLPMKYFTSNGHANISLK